LLFLEGDPGYYGARGFERADVLLRDPLLAEIEEATEERHR